MKRAVTRLVLLVATAWASPVLASGPGSPFGCEDWVIVEPGITCESLIPFPCLGGSGEPRDACVGSGEEYQKVADNEGGVLWLQRRCPPELGYCGTSPGDPDPRCRTEVVRLAGNAEQVIAYVEDRCCVGSPDPTCVEYLAPQGAAFDDKNGRLVMPWNHTCSTFPPMDCANYGFSLARLNGFTTTFEVLQTYEPAAGAFAFRVPYMPEGLAGAMYFDSYVGEWTVPPDFSRARPLRCHYPAAPPRTGERLVVPVTTPNPAAGHCLYFVTAVQGGDERRWGREATEGGVLRGRNPSLLPECVE